MILLGKDGIDIAAHEAPQRLAHAQWQTLPRKRGGYGFC